MKSLSKVLIYCMLYNLFIVTGCVFLGYFIYQGASLWLILIMFILGISMNTPSTYREVNKCPKCGYDGSDMMKESK